LKFTQLRQSTTNYQGTIGLQKSKAQNLNGPSQRFHKTKKLT